MAAGSLPCVNDDAIGRTLRAIRQRLGLRQADVAARAGLSQQVVSALERGGLEQLSLRAARGVARALGAELVISVRWRGAEIDRVRDEDHAHVIAETAAMLEADGWLTATEVTYSWYGERGSIDLLAFHPATRTLLVVEVKTEIASVEETLRRHDAKVRLAGRVARDRFGWDARSVSRFLAVRDTRTARRRIDRHDAVFSRAYPIRGWATRTWLHAPSGAAGLLLFLSGTAVASGSQGSDRVRRLRIRRPRTAGAGSGRSERPTPGPGSGSAD